MRVSRFQSPSVVIICEHVCTAQHSNGWLKTFVRSSLANGIEQEENCIVVNKMAGAHVVSML